ncbi:hypothetical protein ACA758_00820 [Mycoplasmopsis agassizii]|uniref:hypothetical protein n=1 Tax=Mycoplasmopsis agassizii TaxID=33922 RepID=UPI003528E5B5
MTNEQYDLFLSKLFFIIPVVTFLAINLIVFLVYWTVFYTRTNSMIVKQTGLSKNFVNASKNENNNIHFYLYFRILIWIFAIEFSIFLALILSLLRLSFWESTDLGRWIGFEESRIENLKWIGISLPVNVSIILIFLLVAYLIKIILKRKLDELKKTEVINVDFNELINYSSSAFSSVDINSELDRPFRKRRIAARRFQNKIEREIDQIFSKADKSKLDLLLYKSLSKFVIYLWVSSFFAIKFNKTELIKIGLRQLLEIIDELKNIQGGNFQTNSLKATKY